MGEVSLLFFPCSKIHHTPWLAELYLSVCAKFWNAQPFQLQRWPGDFPDSSISAPFHTFYSLIRSFIQLPSVNDLFGPDAMPGAGDETLNRHNLSLYSRTVGGVFY